MVRSVLLSMLAACVGMASCVEPRPGGPVEAARLRATTPIELASTGPGDPPRPEPLPARRRRAMLAARGLRQPDEDA